MKNKTFLALLLSFCIFVPALAQTPSATPPQQPQKPANDKDQDKDDVVRITTNLVQVDAVVTKDGKLVTNLTADDFEIYEDGKKQVITSFAYISNIPNTPPQPVPTTPREKGATLPPPPPVNPNEPHRTIAFVVDDLGLSAESMGQVRKQLRKFVTEQLQPNDLVAIIRTGGEMGALQQFTNDKRILTRAVDQLRWNICNRVGVTVIQALGTAGGPSLCGVRSINGTLRSLRFIVDSMGYLPGRKSLVFMSDFLPREDQDEIAFAKQIAHDGMTDRTGGTENRAEQSRNEGPSMDLDRVSYNQALYKIAEKAIRSSVVIYSVDTQGLQYTGLTAADSFSGGGRQLAELMASRWNLLIARREGGDLIARQTGGFQIRNSNNYGFDRIVQDQTGYYLLGYRPTDETFNRTFHHIKAKVKRSGMSLRTRFGFFGVSEEEANRTKLTPRDLTNLALVSPFAAQDIEVDLMCFFWSDPKKGLMVRSFVYIDAKDLAFTLNNGRQQASFELHTAVFGDNGAMVDKFSQGGTISLSPDDYAIAINNGMGLSIDTPVKRAGAYQVRLAIRDRTTSKIGTAAEFVSVPDLKNKKLAVSGIVLGADAGEENKMASPGSRRFDPNSDLNFAYVIYNASQFANPVMETKLFRDGKNVYSGPEVPIQTAGHPDPARVVTSGKVKLNPDLEPGNYYLQIVITDKDKDAKSKVLPVVQWIDFQIVKSEPAAAAPGLN